MFKNEDEAITGTKKDSRILRIQHDWIFKRAGPRKDIEEYKSLNGLG